MSGDATVAEHDEVVLECFLCPGDVLIKTLSFAAGYASESAVPSIFDDAVLGMVVGEYKVINPSLLSPSWLEFCQLSTEGGDYTQLKVKLRGLKKIERFWEFSENEKISYASTLKTRGNSLFKNGHITRAVRAYKLGIRLLDGSVSVAPAANGSSYKANPDAQNLFITLLLNASLCLLRLLSEQQSSSGSYLSLSKTTKPVRTDQLMRPCIAACRKALDLDPSNAKAWFRMAQAYAALHDYEEACRAGERSLASLDSASKTEPNATTNPLSRTQVSGLLAGWRSLASSQRRKQCNSVRRAFLRRVDAIQRGEYHLGEEGDESGNVEISQWSNEMADNMMSLHEELEAFGETMPEPARKVRMPKDTKYDHASGNRSRLTRIDDAQSEDSNDE